MFVCLDYCIADPALCVFNAMDAVVIITFQWCVMPLYVTFNKSSHIVGIQILPHLLHLPRSGDYIHVGVVAMLAPFDFVSYSPMGVVVDCMEMRVAHHREYLNRVLITRSCIIGFLELCFLQLNM